MSDSKFATFIASKKLDARRILAASDKLESFLPEDRAIKLAKRQAKGEGAEKTEKSKLKPRSGRPITPRAIATALKRGSLTGPQKTRLLNAVNHILEQKKAEKVDLKTLF